MEGIKNIAQVTLLDRHRWASRFDRSRWERWFHVYDVISRHSRATTVALSLIVLLGIAATYGLQQRARFMTDEGHYLLFETSEQRWVHHADCPRCESLAGRLLGH